MNNTTNKKRPTLTLKKPRQPSLSEEEAAKLANQQTQEELRAHSNAYKEKLRPLLENYFSDKSILTEIVLIDGVECLRPLAIGTRKTILDFLRTHPEANGCSNKVLINLVNDILGPHVSREQYQIGLIKFGDRFDIHGNLCGQVTKKQKTKAEKNLNAVASRVEDSVETFVAEYLHEPQACTK